MRYHSCVFLQTVTFNITLPRFASGTLPLSNKTPKSKPLSSTRHRPIKYACRFHSNLYESESPLLPSSLLNGAACARTLEVVCNHPLLFSPVLESLVPFHNYAPTPYSRTIICQLVTQSLDQTSAVLYPIAKKHLTLTKMTNQCERKSKIPACPEVQNERGR